jgi:parallel beta-helix repeat protein
VYDGYIRGMAGNGVDGGTARILECNDLHIDSVHQGIVGRGSLTVEGCVIERCSAECISWEKSTPDSVVLVVDDCEIVGGQSTGLSVGGDWSSGTGTACITETDVVACAGNGIMISLSSGGASGGGRLSAALQDVRASQCGGSGVAMFAPSGPGGTGASLLAQCEDVVCTNNSSSGLYAFSVTVDLIDCASVENSLHGFHLDTVQGSIDNCVAARNVADGILLLASSRMSVSENAAQGNGGAGVHLAQGVSSAHVADNDARNQAIGFQDEGSGNLYVRNSASGNGTNYSLGANPAAIVTPAQLATNSNPHANYSLT